MSRSDALVCCFLSLLFTGQGHVQASQQRGSDQSAAQTVSPDSAVKVTDDELAEHFQGELPLLLHASHAQTDQDSPFMPSFLFDIVVSDSGEVVSADLQTSTRGEPHGEILKQAEALIRTLHFVPFRRNGRPVFVHSTVEVKILPPEELPTENVPFPHLTARQSLVMTLSRSRCLGYCAEYQVRVRGDGRVEYDGRCSVAVTGHYESHLSRPAVDALFGQFRQADFFSLQDRYSAPVFDVPATEISISFDGQQKKVIDHFGMEIGMPDSVTRLELEFDKATNSRRWIIGQSESFVEAAKMHPCK